MDYDSTVYDRGEKLSAGADSVLAKLPPADFQAGIEAMRAHVKVAGDKPVCEPIDVFIFGR